MLGSAQDTVHQSSAYNPSVPLPLVRLLTRIPWPNSSVSASPIAPSPSTRPSEGGVCL